jgi:hypothetical protein
MLAFTPLLTFCRTPLPPKLCLAVNECMSRASAHALRYVGSAATLKLFKEPACRLLRLSNALCPCSRL